ncbi:signal peptidase I [Neisseria perflava]|uniref:signal peptidase I n=1 Tax=Neisseria perflava TaxID=33053 RepID=UPI00209CCD38|nr:signal peptidase I [Neisseria perflava]MCP1660893.1 signal peptidase I [Neisseria perflava]MCP1773189.1 signal peptidase I [Neisseria perflava]
MSNNLLLAAIAAFIVGLVLYFKSSKEREANGEWSGGLQWGYLLMMVGVFGVLSFMMSFTAVLLVFVVFTGVVWLVHKGRLKKDPAHQDKGHFTDYMSGFFPIILIVFVLRTFIAEPFQIPSSSMRPGLVVGDFILVNKFSYSIRTPIINNVLIPTGDIERGDVVVFNYPENPSVNYIKRAVGLPGDVVEYKNKVLSINGQVVADKAEGMQTYAENTAQYGVVDIQAEAYREQIGSHSFQVLKMPDQPAFIPQAVRAEFPYRENCEYAQDGSAFKCTVPAGHYFMMGDNRDNSEDSRYWGFVSDKLIVGKAFLIWMNFGDFGRIGTTIQ